MLTLIQDSFMSMILLKDYHRSQVKIVVIAFNVMLEEFRRQGRYSIFPLELADGRLDPSSAEQNTSIYNDQADIVVRNVLVDEVLSELRPNHAALLMRRLDGLSYSEIGERHGLNESQVEKHLHLARAAVNPILAEQLRGDELVA